MTNLMHIACESESKYKYKYKYKYNSSITPEPTIEKPWEFLITLFFAISDTKYPVTRAGVDAMMDVVFNNPSFCPLLDNPTIYQAVFATESLPQTTPLFKAFWNHIILPAWNQHADIRRACATSQDTAIP